MAITDSSVSLEEWRPCPGFEDRYSVSNLGHVRRDKPANHTWVGKILKPVIGKGYFRVSLYIEDRSKKGRLKHVLMSVHRLVARAFIGEPFPGAVVNHRDGNKLNNNLSNLEWVTVADNDRHATEHGLRPKGQRTGRHTKPESTVRGSAHPRSKLTEAIVMDIKTRLAHGESGAAIGRLHGVTNDVIYQIKVGRTWRHVQVTHGQ